MDDSAKPNNSDEQLNSVAPSTPLVRSKWNRRLPTQESFKNGVSGMKSALSTSMRGLTNSASTASTAVINKFDKLNKTISERAANRKKIKEAAANELLKISDNKHSFDIELNNYAKHIVKLAEPKIKKYFDNSVIISATQAALLNDLLNTIIRTSANDKQVEALCEKYNRLITEVPTSDIVDESSHDETGEGLNQQELNQKVKEEIFKQQQNTEHYYKNLANRLKQNLNSKLVEDSNSGQSVFDIKVSELVQETLKRISVLEIDITNRDETDGATSTQGKDTSKSNIIVTKTFKTLDNPINELINYYIINIIISNQRTNGLIGSIQNFIYFPMSYFWNSHPSTKIALALAVILIIILMIIWSEYIHDQTIQAILIGFTCALFFAVFPLKVAINKLLPEQYTDDYYIKQDIANNLAPAIAEAQSSVISKNMCSINRKGIIRTVDCDILKFIENGPQGALKTSIKVLNANVAELSKLNPGAMQSLDVIAQPRRVTNAEDIYQTTIEDETPLYTEQDIKQTDSV
jgi:uncharacterized protein YdcH (DUF465 family)